MAFVLAPCAHDPGGSQPAHSDLCSIMEVINYFWPSSCLISFTLSSEARFSLLFPSRISKPKSQQLRPITIKCNLRRLTYRLLVRRIYGDPALRIYFLSQQLAFGSPLSLGTLCTTFAVVPLAMAQEISHCTALVDGYFE